MNQHILNHTLEAFTKRYDHIYDVSLVQKPLVDERAYRPQDIGLFISDLILLLAQIEVSAKINYLDKYQFKYAIEEINTPFIVFEKSDFGWVPLVMYRGKQGNLQMDRILELGTEEKDGSVLDFARMIQLADSSLADQELKYVMITGLSWHSMVSHFQQDEESEVLSPVQRLVRLLSNERKDIWYIYVYAIVIGLISLSLPIGVQSIINLISSGQFFNSVIVLISLVILGVLISGALQIMQMTMVEILQRRIFSKAAYELAYRIRRFKMESLAEYYPPELMNRFFEVVNIQKGLPKLLIELTAAFLQIVFGLLLLSFYHPFFIVFTGFLVVLVLLIFRFTGAKGLETNLMESKYKYKVAEWFEELARTLSSFKLAGTTNLPLEKTDQYVNKYLNYRKKHFKILVIQYGNVLAFKTLVTAGILILGTVLVVDRQITLGQFVASELVVIIVVGALEKIVLGIDVVYDMLTGVEKLGHITDLPLEKSKGFVNQLPARVNGMEISLKEVSFSYPNSERDVIHSISLDIPSGARFCISGYNDSGKETLSRLLGGLYTDYTGNFNVNGISFRDIEINHYRDLVSKNSDRSEIFDGTVLENITLNKPGISYRQVTEVLHRLHMMDEINRLPNGILTELIGTGNLLSSSVLEKLILARCLVINPALLIISYPIFMLEKSERNYIHNLLMDKSLPMTVGFITNDQDLQEACDLVFVLEKGTLVASGNYAQVEKHLRKL